MRFRLILLLLVVTGSLTACARADVRDCHHADWFGIGQRDGLAGVPIEIFESYLTACRDPGPVPDREAYANGRRDGLRTYCTDRNGFKVGRGNGVYHHVCPPALEWAFLAGRARGMRLEGCRARIYVFDEHLASLEQALKRRERRLTAPSASAAEQARLKQEIDALETRYQQAAEELATVESRCLEGRPQ
jgi:hypothetical protein